MTDGLKAFSKVLFSNLIVMILGIITTLIIPKYLGPSAYGEYQLYVFYASYLGLLILGYCDGIYLRYGGERYNELNSKHFSQYFNTLLVYLSILSFIFYFIISFFYFNNNILLLLVISLNLQGLNSFFVLLNQATGRFNVYAVTNVIEKTILSIYAIYGLYNKTIVLETLFFIVIMSKLITLIVNMLFDNKVIFRLKNEKKYLASKDDISENIKAGLPLTLSGVVAMLVTGVGRNTIQVNLGYRAFGYYSLVFSMMSIVTQVISAISVVLFPILKNSNKKAMVKQFELSEKLFAYVGIPLNLSFYLIYIVLKLYLPRYLPATDSLAILIPILIYQAKITILYNTYYKILRLERRILKNGIYVLIFSVFTSYILFYFFHTIESIAVATLLSFIFWEKISRFYLFKYLLLKDYFLDTNLIYSVVFVIMAIYLELKLSFILYFLIVLVFFFINRKNIYIFLLKFKKKLTRK